MLKTLFMMALRSGSKGVKNKNIKPLGGVPLFAHAARAVLASAACREGGTLLVNTDSAEYAKLARQLGAITPFLRPGAMATDSSPIRDSIRHTFEFCEAQGKSFDLFGLIQATSPFTTSSDVDRAVGFFQDEPMLKSVISVTETHVPPVWCNTLDGTLSMRNFLSKEIRQKNRQELPPYYRVTGAIRVARWDDFKASDFDWYFDESKALIMDRARSVDIDSEEDFAYAEFLMARRGALQQTMPGDS